MPNVDVDLTTRVLRLIFCRIRYTSDSVKSRRSICQAFAPLEAPIPPRL